MQERPIHAEEHRKNDFLIERIAFFSDAVFAIAITLMILDVRPPLVEKGDTASRVWFKLWEKRPEFLGLIVSFWLIGSAWLRHHQLFKYVSRYDMQLKVVNLLLLFTIILFPFSTSFLFNTLFTNIVAKPQVIFYLGVPLLSNFLLYLMFRIVRKRHLVGKSDADRPKAIFSQGMMVLSFLLALGWVIIVPIEYHQFGYLLLGVGPFLGVLK
ncbi:MAG: TMEM175 family protein, partial [Bacteroidota bacterium]|nr:TMEM175 family protein [Bacteroidota bacterium]